MDAFSTEKRSEIMRRVRSTNTMPEKKVRSLLHRLGFRFRLHQKKLPGAPDIVLPKYSAVIFVHGCFWHRHPGCRNASTPATRLEYWLPKFKRTIARDQKNQCALIEKGWNVILVWECELRNIELLTERLSNAILAPINSFSDACPPVQMAAETNAPYAKSGV